jgi:hypothetical protein
MSLAKLKHLVKTLGARLIVLTFLVVFSLSCKSDSDPVSSGSDGGNGSGTRIGAVCNDGTTTDATGSGACSHHGGVKYWLYR